MLGDVLLIEDKHRKAAKEIKEKLLAGDGPKRVVAISGESGSGKSELSHCLGRTLKDAGMRAKVLHSDNYYHVAPGTGTNGGRRTVPKASAWMNTTGRPSNKRSKILKTTGNPKCRALIS